MVSPDPSRLKRGPCTLSSCRYARESWVCCTLPAGGAPCTSGVAPALRPCPHRGSSSALTQLLSHLSRRVGPAHLSLPMARLLVVTVLLLCARAAHRAARTVWFVNEHTRCIPEDHFGFSISSRPGEAWWRVPDALWACGSPASWVLSPRGGSRNPPPEDPAATRGSTWWADEARMYRGGSSPQRHSPTGPVRSPWAGAAASCPTPCRGMGLGEVVGAPDSPERKTLSTASQLAVRPAATGSRQDMCISRLTV